MVNDHAVLYKIYEPSSPALHPPGRLVHDTSHVSSSLVILFLMAPSLRAEPTTAPGTDAKLALRTASALYDGIQTAELDNGLQVYLKPIPTAASVTTMVVFKVGSADEDKTFTGLSHYLEHLLFKGTVKLVPGDIDRITFRAWRQQHAYTSTDMTAYHFTLPAGRWLPALEVEADRMRKSAIDKAHEFDKEKGGVISELARQRGHPVGPRIQGNPAHPVR